MKAREKYKNHLQKLIQQEVCYFNGWSVSQEAEDDACKRAAEKILNYLARKKHLEFME